MKRLIRKILGRKDSADIAKERLQIVVSHQRLNASEYADLITDIRHELLRIISKRVKIDLDQIQASLSKQDDHSVLELNLTLPARGSQRDPLEHMVKIIT